MKKQIFYLTFIQANTQKGSGVFKKIEAQIKAFNRAGIDVFLGKYNNDMSHYHIIKGDTEVCSLKIVGLSSFKRDKAIIAKVQEFLLANSISIVYTRWEQYSLRSANFYHSLKNKGIDVLLEVPTYPTTERLISLKSDFVAKRYSIFIKRSLAAIYGSMGIPFFKYGVSHIINNNGYDNIWNIPVLKITNAVGVESIPIAAQIQTPNEIRLISVANIADWHGYDRILTGLKEYYSETQEIAVKYTVVGLGDGLAKLKSIVESSGLENYVSFAGFKTGNELTQLFDKSNVGVSILGIHRAGMKYIDTLKGREYCARALPFIT
ncbi:MAG: hypothetical protein Q4E99_05610, partial [Bacillota bacterium]|nr:hypothetical protein [Bacillota bacterium]